MRRWLLFCFTIILLLGACQSKDTFTGREGEEMTWVHEESNMNLVEENGPVMVKISNLRVGNLKPADEDKAAFDNKEKVTLVMIDLKLKNTVDEDVVLSINEAFLTTNTGEAIEADKLISELVGDPFFGKGEKEGNIIFVLDTPAEEINELDLVLPGSEMLESNEIFDEIELNFLFN
ncbi:hypothetical protein SPD48_04445 [Pseudogracilibacillus sp. SE30717A]|uniref:hypothetical protein n=1 Tax=Pseudogracilibacillus sp. SE30717A TaxID=3098293 RepID=UPI00300E5632